MDCGRRRYKPFKVGWKSDDDGSGGVAGISASDTHTTDVDTANNPDGIMNLWVEPPRPDYTSGSGLAAKIVFSLVAGEGDDHNDLFQIDPVAQPPADPWDDNQFVRIKDGGSAIVAGTYYIRVRGLDYLSDEYAERELVLVVQPVE